MRVQLKNVLPNPFRDLDHYPINGQKIEALKKSIKDTEFWDNIVCRKVEGGKVEIAYGHHRLHALNDLYDGDHSISLIPKKLGNEKMLQIMAHENLQEWGHVSDIERETVRAVVTAFGNDEISLSRPAATTDTSKVRLAPNYCFGSSAVTAEHPYTGSTIANFLGWEEKTVQYTLRALCLIEEGNLNDNHLDSLTHNASRVVVDEVRRVLVTKETILKDAKRDGMTETPAKARQIMRKATELGTSLVSVTAMAVSDALKAGESIATAIANGRKARAKVMPEDDVLPDISKMASSIANKLNNFLDPDKAFGEQIEEVVEYKKHLGSSAINDLVMSLSTVIEYAEGFKHQLNK